MRQQKAKPLFETLRVWLDAALPTVPQQSMTGKALTFAKESMELDLEVEDRADEDIFNRILWFSTRGDAPYPAEFVERRSPSRQHLGDNKD